MEISELLALLADAADESAVADIFSKLEADELTAAKAEIGKRLLAIKDGSADLGDDNPVEVAKALRAAYDSVDAELTARVEAAQSAQADIEAATAGLEPEASEEESEEEPAEEEKSEQPVLVTAAVQKAAAYLGRVIADEKAAAQTPNRDIVLTASGIASREGTLSDHATMRDVGRIFDENWKRVTDRQTLIVAERKYPEARQLGSDPVENTMRLNDVTSTAAIIAAGGICAPAQVDFNHPVCGMEGRPIRDALTSFQLSRGALRYGPAISYADLASAITVWDEATDEDPGTAVKACPHVDCETELSTAVQAIVKCITIGNFQARYNPEFFAANLAALNVAFDAAAEAQLYDQITTIAAGASATATTVDTGLGSVPNLLVNMDKLAAGIRSVNRLSRLVTIDVIMPDWIESAIRSHLAAQAPRYAGQYDTPASAWFAARNIRPIYSPDAAPLADPDDVTAFPTSVEFVMFPNGTWVFGDGGTLDLGVVRDSTLNATNDLQVFAEGFEVAFKRGCTSYVAEVELGDDCIDCLVS